ncbi:hypothetical protein DXC99_07140 [Collinsella sp. TF10-11AT]|nr:hypothetical protein DXC99_07140 [Collinsella sp. TF10-11AT]RHA68982.1 hypothetical protein DW925_06390 [Collinsella sp. AM43-1]RHL03944.1 hypothetical protein DW037_07220 [Collinsella sp. AF39-11AT]
MVAALAAILVSPLPAHAEDASGAVTYNAGNGYSFEKLSHPTVGTSQPDGIVDYQGDGAVAVPGADGNTANNEGDRGQSYTWAAASYGDWLYVGTCYAAMGNTLTLMNGVLGDSFDAETMRLTLEAMFNGTFFYGQQKEDGTADKDSGGILVKINTKTGETKLLLSESLNGVGPLFRNAVSYKGKLYFCGSVRTNGGKSGLPAVYEIDPKTDEYKVVYQGLSSMQDYGAAYKQGISTGIRGMCVHDGQLVISNVGKDAAGNFVSTILTSSDPSKGQDSFTEIANSGTLFGYPAIRYQDSIYGGAIWDMVSYNGHLYATICTGTPENAPDDNSMQSFAMVRGDKNADGSYSWTPIVGDQETDGAKYCFGIDPARTRSGAANLIVYNDYLYIGEYNDEEIALERILFNKSNTEEGGKNSMGGVDCSFVNANLEQSVNIYRMDKDENMELVVGDRTDMFPEGGISGLTSGFGRNENQYIWRMQKFDGKLYIGTFDTASLLEPIGQFSNGDIIDMTPEEWDSQVQRLRDLLNHLLDKKSPDDPIVPVNTLADDDSNEAVEVDDSNEAADVDDEKTEVAKGFGDLSDALEDATGDLCDQAATMSQDFEDDAAYVQKIDGEIAYFKSFADQYQDMLDSYENLKQQYEDAYGTELPSDIQDALDKLLSEDNLKKLQSVLTCMCYLRDAERGFDMYVTEDGVNFTTLTTNGFNDPYNHGLRTFAVTNQGLCLGTANPFNGCQVWIQRKENSENPIDPGTPDPTEPTDPSQPGGGDQPGGSQTGGNDQSSSTTTTVTTTAKKTPKDGSLPHAGDSTLTLVLGLLVAAAAVLGIALVLRKRSRR